MHHVYCCDLGFVVDLQQVSLSHDIIEAEHRTDIENLFFELFSGGRIHEAVSLLGLIKTQANSSQEMSQLFLTRFFPQLQLRNNKV